MATATYQVFLPPPDLLPLVEPSNHALPISLHRLEGSASGSSRYISGSSSFLNYQIVPHTDSAQELQAPSAAGPSRPRSEARNDRQISANVPQNLLPPINLRDALPGALGHDTTDSLLSLDTTSPSFLSASIPLSQLPLLGPGGRDDADRSVSNLPRWHIPMSKLTDLATLLSSRTKRQRRGRYSREKALIDDDPPNGTDRYTMIVGVSSTETAVQRQRKEEKAKSKEGTLWIAKWGVVVPSTAELSARGEVDEVGCEVKLWESCAKDWGQGKVRRGDVIMLEGVEFKPASAKDKPHLVLSPTTSHLPKLTILYRTLPRSETVTHGASHDTRSATRDYRPILSIPGLPSRRSIMSEDKALRPDLRLSRSDPGVRRVAEISRWFAHWVGGEGPPVR